MTGRPIHQDGEARRIEPVLLPGLPGYIDRDFCLRGSDEQRADDPYHLDTGDQVDYMFDDGRLIRGKVVKIHADGRFDVLFPRSSGIRPTFHPGLRLTDRTAPPAAGYTAKVLP